MKTKVALLIGGLLVVTLMAGAAVATRAYAQAGTPGSSTDTPAVGLPRHGRGLSQAELEAAAKVLGLSADELQSALEDGKTLEDLAADAGVNFQDVQDALAAVRREELRTQIESGVADGTISQEKADWLLEGLDQGFLDEPGFGLGRGGPGPDHNGPDDGRGGLRLNDAAITAAAQILGMTADEVATALESGTSLQQLAEQAGVDYSTLMDAVRQAMPAPHGKPTQ